MERRSVKNGFIKRRHQLKQADQGEGRVGAAFLARGVGGLVGRRLVSPLQANTPQYSLHILPGRSEVGRIGLTAASAQPEHPLMKHLSWTSNMTKQLIHANRLFLCSFLKCQFLLLELFYISCNFFLLPKLGIRKQKAWVLQRIYCSRKHVLCLDKTTPA